MKYTLTIMTLLLFCMTATTVTAGNAVNSEDNVAGTISMSDAYSAQAMTKADLREAKRADKRALKAEKKQIKMEKRMAKLNNFLMKKMEKKALGGLDDPIDKWLWFAIIGAGAAIVFSFFLWPVSVIFWIASITCLVLWIIKKYG